MKNLNTKQLSALSGGCEGSRYLCVPNPMPDFPWPDPDPFPWPFPFPGGPGPTFPF